MNAPQNNRSRRSGLSLVELLAVVTILAIISVVAVSRFSPVEDDVHRDACYVHQGDIEVKAQLWFRDHGSWPASNMATFGTDSKYFPDGHLPVCPSGGTYTFNAATGEVSCSQHP